VRWREVIAQTLKASCVMLSASVRGKEVKQKSGVGGGLTVEVRHLHCQASCCLSRMFVIAIQESEYHLHLKERQSYLDLCMSLVINWDHQSSFASTVGRIVTSLRQYSTISK